MSGDALRGQVYYVDLGYGRKPWVILSNNARNRNLDTVLAARITTTDRNAHQPTVVALAQNDPLAGHVLVDDLMQIRSSRLGQLNGTLAPETMQRVSAALRLALP